MAEHVINFTTTMLTPLEEPERDYCDPCGLPSLLRWHVAFEWQDKFLLAALTICTDCHREEWNG